MTISNSKDLSPCPWCGSAPRWLLIHNVHGRDLVELACTSQDCPINPSTDGYVTREECSKAWERRHT